ncbi:hypothetical protein [Streptomyces sp. NPDC004533]|uniref:hypothetical protein n=1 Tax=Streptomyces sp. NPDC004533 TaxID=3154278 RepID=UPI0033A98F0A
MRLVYNTGAERHLNRTDGPRKDVMKKHLGDALAGHRIPAMRDRTIRYWRGTSMGAWAARAIASRRDGTLATAVAEGAAMYRGLSAPASRAVPGSTLSPEELALRRHIEDLIEASA